MQIVVQNTETRLIQTLKKAWEDQPLLRTMLLRFYQCETNKDVWLPVLKRAIKKRCEDVHQIYICFDNDVFIVSRSLTQKDLKEVVSQLHQHLQPAFPSRLASLFEVNIDWHRIKTILEKKLQQIRHSLLEKQPNNKEQLPSINTKDIIKQIDPSLLKTIAQRRNNRAKAEIMVVEDDTFTQKLIANTLRQYALSITSDGKGALINYISKAPDILFLDINLPDFDGHTVLKKIFEFDPDAFIVMFSGNGDAHNIKKAIAAGAKGFIGKPFTRDKIISYIEKSPFIQNKVKKGASA